MKKLTTLLMTLMLMSSLLWADQTVTVSANSSDISEGLDLKVVAKLFAEAKNLEEFETMLNNPDSAFCNLDLNGDGQVDYLRVVETGEGSKRLIVLQAVLAKDIYQDVASIYVEKDENEQVSVQVVGDEYVYGANYVIEPVYIYRPGIAPGTGITGRDGGAGTPAGHTTGTGITATLTIIITTGALSVTLRNRVEAITRCTTV